MTIYHWIIVVSWLAFLIYWGIGALSAKKVTYRDPTGVGIRYIGLAVFILAIIFDPHVFSVSLGAYSSVFLIIGSILCAAGIGIAIWARAYLGKNWSSGPSIQEGHELVTTGPYRFVRHPIYTGVLLAILGSAIASSLGWLIVLLFAGAMFVWRVGREETFMMQLFPNEYPEYRKHTKKLIPFVW